VFFLNSGFLLQTNMGQVKRFYNKALPRRRLYLPSGFDFNTECFLAYPVNARVESMDFSYLLLSEKEVQKEPWHALQYRLLPVKELRCTRIVGQEKTVDIRAYIVLPEDIYYSHIGSFLVDSVLVGDMYFVWSTDLRGIAHTFGPAKEIADLILETYNKDLTEVPSEKNL